MPIEELDEKADTAFKIRSFFFPPATIPETYSPAFSCPNLFSLGNQPFF